MFFATFVRSILALTLLSGFTLHTQEIITSFESTIAVEKTGTLLVHEKICVTVTNDQIKHGIVRSFPLYYKDAYNTHYAVRFNLISIHIDGIPAQHQSVSTEKGVDIYIGDKTAIISRGPHIYELIYTTSRQLGFFKDFDELYWNVTGNEWEFPIQKAIARIHFELPSPPPHANITTEAYTGYLGSQEKDYSVSKTEHTITYETTRSLNTHEGFTIVLTWPKGYIDTPSFLTKLYWFLSDNKVIIWFLLWLILLCFWYIFSVMSAHKSNKPGTIIPLFDPPSTLTPSGIGFINSKEFGEHLISPDIIFLATKGLLTIHYDQKSHLYTLSITSKGEHISENTHLNYDTNVLNALFKKQKTITLNSTAYIGLTAVSNLIKNECTKNYSHYFNNNYFVIIVGIFISIIACVPLITLLGRHLFSIIPAMLLFVNLAMSAMVRAYTPSGRKIQDEIEGFKLFLATTEYERIKIIGTPPTKTPELYEKYLPYAMALGLESAWTQQFTPLFEELTRNNKPYSPSWYQGTPWQPGRLKEIHQSITVFASSAARPPGYSSGASGRGSSGGGGGGGGGRGW